MAGLIRFDPFGIARTDPFSDIFEDLWKGNLMRPFRLEIEPQMQLRMDVKEKDKAYIVHAEIPGVKKEDIHVSIDKNQVTISAEVKKEHEEKEGERTLRCERYYGSVYRSFTLDHEIDESAASAKYSDGVLELTLPKKAQTTVTELAVH